MTRVRWSCVSLLALALGVFAPGTAAAATAYALNPSGQLLIFDLATPETVQTLTITSLKPGEKLIALDVRPQDGRLYALSDQGRLYRLWPPDGYASRISDTTIGLALDGTEFAMDTDPITGQFRVMSNTGQNFRIDWISGEVIDGSPAPGLQPDTPLGPGLPDVRAAAFLNNFPGATSTLLFAIDAAAGQLRVMNDPDNGVLTPRAPINVALSSDVSLDIAGPTNFALMVIPEGAGSRIYRLNLLTGAAEPGAVVGTGLASQRVKGFAVKWTGDYLRAITADNHMIRFVSTAPGTLLSDVAITGLQPGESIAGLDFRPSNPDVAVAYALGSTGRLYRINAAGQAVQVGLGTFSVPLAGTRFGFNFDPTSDLIRVVSNSDLNFRIDPDTGLAVDGNPDVDGIQPDSAINPSQNTIEALAWVGSATGNLQPAFYAVDPSHNTVFRLGGINDAPSASTGTLTPVTVNIGADPDTPATFDWSLRENIGYATLVGGGINLFHFVNAQGVWTTAGQVGNNTTPALVALAVEPGSVFRVAPESADEVFDENDGSWFVRVLRTNTDQHVTLRLRVTGGTATLGQDYLDDVHLHRVILGLDEGNFGATIVDDLDAEPGETIELTVEAIEPGTMVLGNPTMVLTIRDNDSVQVGPPTVTITSPFDDNGPNPIGTSDKFVTISGTATGPAAIKKVTWLHNWGGGEIDAAGDAEGTSNWTIPNLELHDGFNQVIVYAWDVNGKVDSEAIGLQRSLDQYSLAEGATGTFFNFDLAIANPNPVEAPVDITFLTSKGFTVTQQRVLPPGSRTTIAVDDIQGLENAEVSAVVKQTSTPSLPLAVERTMSWDTSGYGAHTEKAVNGSGSRTWLFAEGSQGFFETYFLLANPGDTQNDAVVEMYTENGTLAASTNYSLAPHSRLTVYAGDIPGAVNQSFWTRVTFTELGIAERAMYFGAPLFNAGHESHGVALPSKTWFHAEGATGTFFTTFLLLANPNDQAAQVTLTYLPASGVPVTVQRVLQPKTRTTINVALEDPSLANAAVATRIESSLQIVSERSMYWPGAPANWYEAHNSFGDIATDTKWALAEGRTGGPDAYQTYILLANPGDEAATVTVMFLRENAALVQKEYQVAPGSRFNIDVSSMVPELSNERFGAFVQSSKPIFVERAMYSNAGGVLWSAGTGATATRVP